jgi:hypothetical protein
MWQIKRHVNKFVMMDIFPMIIYMIYKIYNYLLLLLMTHVLSAIYLINKLITNVKLVQNLAITVNHVKMNLYF